MSARLVVRGLLGGMFALSVAVWTGPVAAADCDGTGFFPPGDHPIASLTLAASVEGNAIHISGATLSAAIELATMVTSREAERLGLVGTKNRFGLDFPLDLRSHTFTPLRASVTVLYPYQLTNLPLVSFTGAGLALRTLATRQPDQPKLSDVYATFEFAPDVARRLTFGQSIVLAVTQRAGGQQLERVTATIPTAEATRAMLDDAKRDLQNACSQQ